NGKLKVSRTFFDARNGMSVDALLKDTEKRAKSIPRRKLEIQKHNLDRRTDEYVQSGSVAPGLFEVYQNIPIPNLDQIRQEALQRPKEGFPASTKIDGDVFVDRELYRLNTNYVTLFRYFLEPLGVSVDKWSLGVRGRSRTYAFADVFEGSGNLKGYIETLERMIVASLKKRPARNRISKKTINMSTQITDAEIIKAVNATLQDLDKVTAYPTFTDIQRIYNKACISCHGGLEYPPYSNYTNGAAGRLNFAEDERPGKERLKRSHLRTLAETDKDLGQGNTIYQLLIDMDESWPNGMMPFGGPPLSQADIETFKRWILAKPKGRPFSLGDPHIRTVDGTSYDFQGAGEFVLLRGDFFEIQTRNAAVATNSPLGPNGHTGLTTCVSINTAVAIEAADHRITYQQDPNQPDALILRVDGKPVTLGTQPIHFAPGCRILRTTAAGDIRIDIVGGSSILVTPWFWTSYQVWGMGIDVPHARAFSGIMGEIPADSWLPRLPDGRSMGPMPEDLWQRYEDLYDIFGEAWRVNDSISLFDYGPGESAATFAVNGWPRGESPQDCSLPSGAGQSPISRAEAEEHCKDVADPERRELCIQDVMATGAPGWSAPYVRSDKLLQNQAPTAAELAFPEDDAEGLSLPIHFRWKPGTDPDGGQLAHKIYIWPVHEVQDNNQAVEVPLESGPDAISNWQWTLLLALIGFVLWLICFFLFRKTRPRLLLWLALIVILVAMAGYFLMGSETAQGERTPTSMNVADLETGQDYFWRVITEDENGEFTLSEKRRFKLN
ncbi:MAG: hypothetical protein AAF570_10115, partial [Bacteroidota bacterium]